MYTNQQAIKYHSTAIKGLDCITIVSSKSEAKQWNKQILTFQISKQIQWLM